ncbi:MAG: DUF4255 domain-containing protein [Deltaproteobacteria bacterium]|nr:DUF4255 domain-containing protein [Deltaproteobacteria bacterium]
MYVTRTLPEGFERGPMQGPGIIGEVTEAMHRFILDGWVSDSPPPRIEEDLSFVPKDREEVIYLYMYRVGQNQTLQNTKRWRPARFSVTHPETGDEEIYYERAPIYLELSYLLAVHAKFRSDAERLLGWLMLRLHEATHLVYRPRRYQLPDGREIDSLGRPWDIDADGDELIMEKIAVSLTDDLTIGDAINFYTIHEAPFRPYVTYKARCAMEGSLISAPAGTLVRALPLESSEEPLPPHARSNGRLGRAPARPVKKTVPGPEGRNIRPIEDDNPSED